MSVALPKRTVQPEEPYEPFDLETDWTPPMNLEAPPARPGFSQRWVGTIGKNGEDGSNMYKYMRNGWEARRADTIQKGATYPTTQAGTIGIHGNVLMEIRTERLEAHRQYLRRRTDMMMEGVDNDIMKIENKDMPISRTKRTRSSVGRRPMMDD